MSDVHFVLTPVLAYEITSITDTEDDMTYDIVIKNCFPTIKNERPTFKVRKLKRLRIAEALALANEEASWESCEWVEIRDHDGVVLLRLDGDFA